jgi:hypothetical protein
LRELSGGALAFNDEGPGEDHCAERPSRATPDAVLIVIFSFQMNAENEAR